jgi:hypothetical protein
MKQALSFIISNLLENSENVEIKEQDEDGITNFIVVVPQAEMGRIIGKEGKVIRAIRNVVKIPAIREGKRINITLEEKIS